MSEDWRDPDDPFALKERAPAVSWKGAPFGASIVAKVLARPEEAQQRDYDTGEQAWWDDQKTQPKMAVVILVEVDGQKLSLWAPKPSSMFAAIGEAVKEAQTSIRPGGVLRVTFTHEEPNQRNPRLNPAKQFKAVYEPPDAFSQGQPSQGSWSASGQSNGQPAGQQQQAGAWSPAGSTVPAGQADEPPF